MESLVTPEFPISVSQASGEVMPKFEGIPVLNLLRHAMGTQREGGKPAPLRLPRRRRQILALVVTIRHKLYLKKSKKTIEEMKRSGALISGQGIYSHEDRSVILGAITVAGVAHLKAIVRAQDSQAFVSVMPVPEVWARAFNFCEEKMK